MESAFTCMDTRVSVALARLESRLAEVDQEEEKKMALMRETLIASVKALRIEMAEGEKEKKDEEDEKNLRPRKRLPPQLPLVSVTVPEAEHHFHQPTAASVKKHVYLVDGRMTTRLGLDAADAAEK